MAGGENGGDGGDGGRGDPPHQVGNKRTRDIDTYAIDVAETSEDEVSVRVDHYAALPNPAGTTDSHAQLQLNRGENYVEVDRGSGNAPPAGKRLRVDDPVTRPLLGDSGVHFEEYLRNYSERLVDAQRFALFTPAVRSDDDFVHVPFPQGGFVKLPPRELLWKLRWAHVGNLVKL